jgi:hypothetical protein
MKTVVSSRGQIVLPAEFRRMDRVEAGQEFDVERVDRGDYRLVRRAAPPNQGAIDWLLACPRKDFFVPIESESTDARNWHKIGNTTKLPRCRRRSGSARVTVQFVTVPIRSPHRAHHRAPPQSPSFTNLPNLTN